MVVLCKPITHYYGIQYIEKLSSLNYVEGVTFYTSQENPGISSFGIPSTYSIIMGHSSTESGHIILQ